MHVFPSGKSGTIFRSISLFLSECFAFFRFLHLLMFCFLGRDVLFIAEKLCLNTDSRGSWRRVVNSVLTLWNWDNWVTSKSWAVLCSVKICPDFEWIVFSGCSFRVFSILSIDFWRSPSMCIIFWLFYCSTITYGFSTRFSLRKYPACEASFSDLICSACFMIFEIIFSLSYWNPASVFRWFSHA